MHHLFTTVLMACVLGTAVAATPGDPRPRAAFDIEGHRGARGLAPENTLAGFRKALDIGVTVLETDIAITRDLVPVISHDPVLNPDLVRDRDGRWLERPGPPIHALTRADLAQFDIGRVNPASAYARDFPSQRAVDGERFPTLAELLQLVGESGKPVRLNLEIKMTPDNAGATPDAATFARVVLAAVDEAGIRKRVIVQGFDWRPLLELKRMAPEIETACLTIESRQMNTVAPGPDGRSPWHAGLALRDHDGSVPALVRAAGCATWSPSRQDLTRALVDEAHALGLRVIPWTVNDEAEMRRLIDLGVDGIITDYPDRLRKAVQAKGLPLP